MMTKPTSTRTPLLQPPEDDLSRNEDFSGLAPCPVGNDIPLKLVSGPVSQSACTSTELVTDEPKPPSKDRKQVADGRLLLEMSDLNESSLTEPTPHAQMEDET